MAHTKLFKRIQVAMQRAYALEEVKQAVPQFHGERALSRRSFLKMTACGAGAALVSSALPAWANTSSKNGEKIAVIGGGAAGLTAAYRLMQQGYKVTVFEASSRLGGRMFTHDAFNDEGMFCELGGELVDSNHLALKKLCRELGVAVQSLASTETGEELFFFGGRYYTLEDLVDARKGTGAFLPVAKSIAADQAKLLDASEEWTQYARELDEMNLAAYLEAMRGKVEDWVLELLRVAYIGEYGLEAEEQSALNLVDMIGVNPKQEFALFGESDEGARIAGGSSRLIEALEKKLKDKVEIKMRHRLVSLASGNQSLEVGLDHDGEPKTQYFSHVVLALPFSVLREVKGLDALELDPLKLAAIQTLGYGTNAKLMLGTTSPVWRKHSFTSAAKSDGTFYTDTPAQLFWDTSRGQKGTQGILTNFLGGKAGEEKKSRAIQQGREALAAMSPVLSQALKPEGELYFRWSTHPFARGSYTCPGPGQYTRLLEVAGAPELEGRLLFCGEHTSVESQGFMNGAIESAERVASHIYTVTKNLKLTNL